MAFGRTDLREALGDAYTDDIAKKLINLHRGVVDPLKDDLDSAKRESDKWKKEAEKLNADLARFQEKQMRVSPADE